MHPVGFEPTHLAALEPESSVYANFTTGAKTARIISYRTVECKGESELQKENSLAELYRANLLYYAAHETADGTEVG